MTSESWTCIFHDMEWKRISTCHQWLRLKTGAASCRLQARQSIMSFCSYLRSTGYGVRTCDVHVSEPSVPIAHRIRAASHIPREVPSRTSRTGTQSLAPRVLAPEHATGCRAAWQWQPKRAIRSLESQRERDAAAVPGMAGDHWYGLSA